MSLARRLVMGTIKTATQLTCRIDASALARVPAAGPLIIAANHINFLEVPVLYTHLLPRPLTGLVKAESFHGAFSFFFRFTDGIPLRRGEGDAVAFRKALAILKTNAILAIAPEGTRSGDGRLQAGQPGVALLALHSEAPILPMAYWGGEAYWDNLKRLRRTPFFIAVDQQCYRVDLAGRPANQATRQAIADEIMIRVATLLPAAYRGVYADRLDEPRRFLQPIAPARAAARP